MVKDARREDKGPNGRRVINWTVIAQLIAFVVGGGITGGSVVYLAPTSESNRQLIEKNSKILGEYSFRIDNNTKALETYIANHAIMEAKDRELLEIKLEMIDDKLDDLKAQIKELKTITNSKR